MSHRQKARLEMGCSKLHRKSLTMIAKPMSDATSRGMISLVPCQAIGYVDSYEQLGESGNDAPLHSSLRECGKD